MDVNFQTDERIEAKAKRTHTHTRRNGEKKIELQSGGDLNDFTF